MAALKASPVAGGAAQNMARGRSPGAAASPHRRSPSGGRLGVGRMGSPSAPRHGGGGGGGVGGGGGGGGGVGGGGGGGGGSLSAAHSLQQPFEPASLDEMQRETDVAKGGPGDVHVAPLTPAHVMSRNYLRFGTMSLFSLVRELPPRVARAREGGVGQT